MKILHSKQRSICIHHHFFPNTSPSCSITPTGVLVVWLGSHFFIGDISAKLCCVIRSITSAGTDDMLYHSCAPQNASAVWCFPSTQHTSTKVLQIKTWVWIHCYSFHHHFFLIYIFFFLLRNREPSFTFNQRGVESTQMVNLNTLVSWQAVSYVSYVPRGTYPNKNTNFPWWLGMLEASGNREYVTFSRTIWHNLCSKTA